MLTARVKEVSKALEEVVLNAIGKEVGEQGGVCQSLILFNMLY